MERKTGLDYLIAPLEDIGILCQGSSDILEHNHPNLLAVFREIGVLHFSIAHGELLSGNPAGNPDLRNTNHVLTHIIDIYPRTNLLHTYCLQLFYNACIVAELAREFHVIIIQDWRHSIGSNMIPVTETFPFQWHF